MFNIETLRSKSDSDLAKITNDLGVKTAKNSTDNDKIFAILDFQASNTKVVKDYFNATETPMNTEETNAPAPKKPAVKKPAPKKKAEKPVEDSAEAPKEILKEVAKNLSKENKEVPAKIEAETAAESLETDQPKPQNQQKKKRQRVAPPKSEADQTEKEVVADSEVQAEPKAEQPKNQNSNPNQAGNGNGNPNQGGNQNKQPQHKNQNQHKNPNQHKNQQNNPSQEEPAKKEFNFDGLVTIEGVLEILPDNYGFLRSSDFSYISSPDDVYVSTNQIRNYALKTGDTVKGIVRLPKEGEKYFSLLKPTEVNGRDLEFIKDRVAFEFLTPLFPEEKFNLTGKNATPSTRIVD